MVVTVGGMGGHGICNDQMTGIIRDFKQEHPDFEYVVAEDPGIIDHYLGPDGKPMYIGRPEGTLTTTGPENFDQWYRDVDGVNLPFEHTIQLSSNKEGVYSYENTAFFPIDTRGWGREQNDHNYHFTFELRTQFIYRQGDVFSFTGDDDLFVFINGRLALDLGGVHPPITGQVSLDERAQELGIQPGGIYPLDIFHAERHRSLSNFAIETSIAFVECEPPPPE